MWYSKFEFVLELAIAFCEEDVIGSLLEGDLGVWVKNSTFHDLVINTDYSVCDIERSTLIS